MKKQGRVEQTKKGVGTGKGATVRPSPAKAKPLSASEKKVLDNQLPLALVPKEARTPVRQAYDLEVVDRATMQQATDLIGVLKALVGKIEEDYEPQLKSARDTLAKIRKARDDKTGPLADAIAMLRDKNEQCEDKLKEIARKAAVNATKAARIAEERERRKAAADLIIQGKEAEAARLLAAPSDVQEIKAQPIQLNGRIQQIRWKWELRDISKVNPDYLTTKDGEITALVRTFGKADPARREEIKLLLGEGIDVIEYPVDSYETAEEAEA